MAGNDSLRISDIKDKRLQELAKTFDKGGKKGILEGQELINFNKAKANYKPNTIVVKVKDVRVLKTPGTVLNTRNILTVIENYEKDNDGKTLLGDFMKDDRFTRTERKNGAIKTFEILYNKVLTGAKTDFQKQELLALKERFNKVVTEEMDDSWFEWGISTSEVNEIVEKMQKMYTASSEELAHEIYDHADDNNFSYADKDFRYLLNSLDSGNAISVAQQVKNYKNNKNHESLLQVLAQEYTMPFSDEQKAEKKAQIKNFVNSYFKAAGFSESTYLKDAQKLLNSITDAWDTTSLVNTSDIKKLDSIMDTLIINKPKDIADKLYKIINDNSFAFSRTDTKILLDKINNSNINEVLEEFKKNGEKKSLLQMIDEEWGDDEVRKSYINKLVKTQLDASGLAKNKEIVEHVNASFKNESVADAELLMSVLGKNKDVNFISKTLFNSLSKDEDNLDKQAIQYLLDGINKSNVMQFMQTFNKLSKGKPITQYLQEKGDARANEYILSITDSILEVNDAKFQDEDFSSTFAMLKTDVKDYIRNHISDKDDITRVVNSFLPASATDIAKNIEAIADDKTHAPEDVSFKLWIAKIDKSNAREVIKAYQEKFDKETPINAIIEEYGSDVGARQSQILHVLSSLVGEIGEDKVNPGNIADFNAHLEDELFGYLPASAGKLNNLLAAVSAGIPEKGQAIENTNADISTLTNIRPQIAELSLGEKYGNFSWQYSNLKNIKSMDDISKLTGLSVDYLNEMKITEGVRKTAYKCSSNKRTIGIGHNFHNTKGAERKYLDSNEITDSEIYQILAYDLVKAINKLQNNRNIDTSKLTQGQFEALVDVSFNAPGYMKTLSEKTNAAIDIKESSGDKKAQKAFDEAAFEFNQQYSNAKIASGLCKRRVRNILRYCGVDSFKDLPADSEAKKRVIILAKNGYNASSMLKKVKYTEDICKILGITKEEFSALKYPKGYKS